MSTNNRGYSVFTVTLHAREMPAVAAIFDNKQSVAAHFTVTMFLANN